MAAKKLGLVGLIKKAAREAATERFGAMAIGDVAAARVDGWLDQSIEACVDFGLDYDRHEDLCGEFTDAFADESEQLADAAGIAPEPSGCPVESAPIIKTCSKCHRSLTAQEWAGLKQIGVQRFNDPENPDLSLRNCDCGTTLALELSQEAR